MNYRNPKLLRLARKAPRCFFCGASNQGDVVAAHSNQLRDGHGMGIKSSDARVAFLCSACHFELDNGADLTRQERISMFESSHRATMGWLFESGSVVVK